MLLIGLLLFVASTFCTTAQCVAQTEVYIDPPKIEDPTLEIGDRFTINISIANVSNLYSYELNMSYNTDILTCVGVTVGPEDNLPLPNWEVDDDTGNVWINVTYDVPVTTTSSVTIATLTFSVQGRGTSTFDLYYTRLINPLGQLIPHEVSDGYFRNGSLYDLNKDGHVNMADVNIVALAFGSAAVDNPSTPWDETVNWNPLADLSKDGKVDIVDMVLMGIHFGEI